MPVLALPAAGPLAAGSSPSSSAAASSSSVSCAKGPEELLLTPQSPSSSLLQLLSSSPLPLQSPAGCIVLPARMRAAATTAAARRGRGTGGPDSACSSGCAGGVPADAAVPLPPLPGWAAAGSPLVSVGIADARAASATRLLLQAPRGPHRCGRGRLPAGPRLLASPGRHGHPWCGRLLWRAHTGRGEGLVISGWGRGGALGGLHKLAGTVGNAAACKGSAVLWMGQREQRAGERRLGGAPMGLSRAPHAPHRCRSPAALDTTHPNPPDTRPAPWSTRYTLKLQPTPSG